jgi:hypothetical protein
VQDDQKEEGKAQEFLLDPEEQVVFEAHKKIQFTLYDE